MPQIYNHIDIGMTTRITTQHVEKHIQGQRIIEDKKRELNHYANESSKLLSAANSLAKVDARRKLTAQQAREMEIEYATKEREDDYNRRLKERTVLQNQVNM